MEYISKTNFISLNPLHYKGLRDHALQKAVRKYSTFELFQPTALEEIELFVSNSIPPLLANLKLMVVFFGKDGLANEEVHWECASQPFDLSYSPQSLFASESLVDKWFDFSFGKILIVERVGFYTFESEVSLTITAKTREQAEAYFMDM